MFKAHCNPVSCLLTAFNNSLIPRIIMLYIQSGIFIHSLNKLLSKTINLTDMIIFSVINLIEFPTFLKNILRYLF